MLQIPHNKTAQQVIEQLETSTAGLTLEEAERRREQYGPNRLPPPVHVSLGRIILHQFLDPLIYVLVFAAFLSFIIGELADAAFIFVVLLVNAAIGAIQESQAQRSAASLQDLVTRNARVQRDGEAYEINAEQLVPGDMVLLESGDKVPADMRLVNSQDLDIDESLLSGESLPVTKQADVVLDEVCVAADRINMAFSGTLVAHGRAVGVVTATALGTQLGQIASDVLQRQRVKPPLLQRMERFSFRLTVIMCVVIGLLGVGTFIQGMPLVDVFLMAVALAVAAIPEGLPVAMTVALAISIRRMARRNVIARRLVTVEALGSCTCIATDKTGTLTRNQISVEQVALPGRESFVLPLTRLVETEERQGYLEQIAASELPGLQRLARAMVLTNEGFLGHRNGEWVRHGDSIDTALLVFGHNLGFVRQQLLQDYPPHTSLPYESAARYSAALHDSVDGQQVFVKGAVETLLPMCSRMVTAAGSVDIDPQAILAQANALAAQGYRVLAAASGAHSGEPNTLVATDLQNLTFLGVVGMIDPLREESVKAIEACHSAGIEVAMLTGDHPVTAYAIAEQLGLAHSRDEVVTSQELLDSMEQPHQHDDLIRSTRVFARLEPHQKLDIVSSLQQQGHFVAVTGDGANDAPALRAAHVGVAMGKGGTDIARETADIILIDDNFASIVAGIEEGRIAYSNVRKVIHLLLSTGAGEIVLFLLSLFAGLPIPLTAVQLLWLNLVTNGLQDVALAFEPGEGHELKQPPRAPGEAIFNRVMIERVLMSAMVIGIVAFATFSSLLAQGASIEEARNITLLVMVLFENVHIFNSRSETQSAFVHNPLRNPFLLICIVGAHLLHLTAMFVPGLNSVLEIAPISLLEWSNCLLLALTLLVASELYKWLRAGRVLKMT
jgi:Ca2+-transporting ATPase